MGARKQLAKALEGALDGVRVVSDFRSVESVDPALRGLIQVVRTTIKPSTEQDRYRSTWEMWVAANNADLEQAEDPLDDMVDDVVEALATFKWVGWEDATRAPHPTAGLPAYRFTLTTTLKGV